MLRHQFEVDEELQALETLKQAADGDEDRVECIEAQMTTIRDGMTRQEVEESFSEDEPVFEAAVLAFRWLREDDEAPSRYWQTEEFAQAA